MRSPMISFRASPEQADAIRTAAKVGGLSLSEYLRQALSLAGEPPPPISLEAPAELPLHTRAAMGDGDAFAALADIHYRQACDGYEPAVLALAQARVYSRLAAMARGSREDCLTHVYVAEQHALVLRDAGLSRLADDAQGEAVALAEYMADDGDEEVAQMIVNAGEALSPAALTVARNLREHVREQVGVAC